MIAPLSPVPVVELTVSLGGRVLDLATHALVAAVVPLPRFGREGEAAATAAALVAQGADLVDVSLPPRLLGPVVRSAQVPVVARVGSVDDAVAAARAGASAVLVGPELLDAVCGHPGLDGLETVPVVVVDDLSLLGVARSRADERGLVTAFDSTRLPAAAALGCESAAIAEGCRLVRTADVRRSRRVAEVMSAVLAARRPGGSPSAGDTGERDDAAERDHAGQRDDEGELRR